MSAMIRFRRQMLAAAPAPALATALSAWMAVLPGNSARAGSWASTEIIHCGGDAYCPSIVVPLAFTAPAVTVGMWESSGAAPTWADRWHSFFDGIPGTQAGTPHPAYCGDAAIDGFLARAQKPPLALAGPGSVFVTQRYETRPIVHAPISAAYVIRMTGGIVDRCVPIDEKYTTLLAISRKGQLLFQVPASVDRHPYGVVTSAMQPGTSAVTRTIISVPGATATYVQSINANGAVGGIYSRDGTTFRPFEWNPNPAIGYRLVSLPGDTATAMAAGSVGGDVIGDTQSLAGIFTDAAGNQKIWYANGTRARFILDRPNTRVAWAGAIRQDNHVALSYFDAGTSTWHFSVWDGHSLADARSRSGDAGDATLQASAQLALSVGDQFPHVVAFSGNQLLIQDLELAEIPHGFIATCTGTGC